MHLELAEDQSAETFLHAIRRFVARRGYPGLILSDNATQFQAFKTIITQVAVSNFLAKEGMTWKNIVPKAPWQGGIYERLIGLTKNALKRAISKYLTERELVMLIAEIEGILNTRPLTYANFDDYVIIRPIDFTLPNASLHLPMIKNDDIQEEFISHRINDAKINKDGQVRNVQVETPWETGKLLNRPINVLYPLEVNNDDHLELDNKEITKVLEIKPDTGELQEPIAMRTRSNTN
uniref:Integrase catalytic domain-containing protein n=1 Tax=Loa loa TaxID=7209 RepID=A0A1I7V6A0_LOALO